MNNKANLKRKILSILINTTDIMTVKELADSIEKSSRTVRTYLSEIKDELKEKDVELVVRPSVGVFIILNDNQRAELKRMLNVEKIDSYSSEYRIYYILSTLLRSSMLYTISLFAEELYCSNTTISNDLVQVEQWLDSKNLKLVRKQNQGLWVEGTERNYRRALIDMLYEYRELGIEVDIKADAMPAQLDYRFDVNNYKYLLELFPAIDLVGIQNIVLEAEERLGYYFTDLAFINLITHIAITIERVKNKQQVKMRKEVFASISKKEEYKIAEWVVKQLSETYKIQFPDDEVNYISLHMLGAKIQEDFSENNYQELLVEQNESYINLAKEIVKLTSDILDVNLNDDEILLTSLILHLRPTIIRLQYGLKLRNPLLKTIKKEYTSIFGAAWACNALFEKHYGFFINEDEVAYIAMHLAVAVARKDSRVKVVIVCSSGVGTSQLVASRLKAKIDNIELIAVIPVKCLSDELIKEADIIISTVRFPIDNNKVVYVGSMLDEKDILRIKNHIGNVFNIKHRLPEQKKIDKNPLKGILDERLCYIFQEKRSFSEIIEICGQRMVDDGYVKEGFIEDVLEREKKGSTYIGKGISIPHSKASLVNKSKVCTIKLNHPIIWKDNEINVIFLLALKISDGKSVKSFFNSFYSVLENEEIVGKIINSKQEKTIINLLLNGGSKNGEQYVKSN